LTKKLKITSEAFSKKAIERIKSAGGEAIQPKKEAEIKKEPEKVKGTEAK
jgi:ribosomal protein L18E